MRNLFGHSAFRNPSVLIGGSILLLLLAVSILAPLLTQYDPQAIAPRFRLKFPSDEFLMGTDMLGRDVWTRVVHGGRVSLLVSAVVAIIAISIGLAIGLTAGYIRWLDGPVMRTMDGLMAIPGILLAIALVSLSGASLLTVIIAIVIPEIPRVARLVRGVVLSIREEPYVEAAVGLGTPTVKILIKHILPNTIAPLIVQGTYICASAILVESILSFLGAGLPPEIPTWGNIIAEGRAVFQRAPWIILFPGGFLAVTILAVNILGDGLRDTLDPRMKKRLGA
ncbi:ABC transporter permease [Ferrovibrio sp.]|jgi:peptide/nickel transport system permease protein|uniref:ABC transporter permease n=1 Tax=Ferrovibrio sp. TaxID=1917215 RepID=UPI000CC33727|nr:ABC transporter permease [Ferrovibrio sp.]PJI41940.1 MAG: peptide ABC transporter permease [Ferrovibrio sp.]